MFENIMNFFKKLSKKEKSKESSDTAKERLHLVLMQDRANVSADFLELMRKEIIEVIKKYVDVDEKEIDVHLTNKSNEDGTVGAPALYANIPIVTIKNEARKANVQTIKKDNNKPQKENKQHEKSQEKQENLEEKNASENDKSEKIKNEDQANNETTIEKNESEQVAKPIEENEEQANNEITAEKNKEQTNNETSIEESKTEQDNKQNNEDEVEETIEKIDKEEETTSNQ